MAGGDKYRIGLRQNCLIQNQPFGINIQRGDMLRTLQQNVAQIRVARVFNHHLFLLVNQQLGDQIQRVLRTQSDQNLFRPGFDAAAWQAARTDIIDQHRIIMLAKITGHRREIAHAQRLSCAIAPFRMRK